MMEPAAADRSCAPSPGSCASAWPRSGATCSWCAAVCRRSPAANCSDSLDTSPHSTKRRWRRERLWPGATPPTSSPSVTPSSPVGGRDRSGKPARPPTVPRPGSPTIGTRREHGDRLQRGEGRPGHHHGRRCRRRLRRRAPPDDARHQRDGRDGHAARAPPPAGHRADPGHAHALARRRARGRHQCRRVGFGADRRRGGDPISRASWAVLPRARRPPRPTGTSPRRDRAPGRAGPEPARSGRRRGHWHPRRRHGAGYGLRGPRRRRRPPARPPPPALRPRAPPSSRHALLDRPHHRRRTIRSHPLTSTDQPPITHWHRLAISAKRKWR